MQAWSVRPMPQAARTDAAEPGPGLRHRSAGSSCRSGRRPARARMYVCGITPYDATHIGHANTYVAFDLLNRVWRDAGLDVDYVQNVTDVDDPLLERAAADGRRLAVARRAADPALSRGHGRAERAAARAPTSAPSRRSRRSSS